MSPIDQRAEQFALEYAEKLTTTLQQDLISIFLYGSATTSHFEPGQSNINLMAVVTRINPERLRVASEEGRKFRIYGIEPLFLTQQEFQRLPELFPIESLEMRENYRILSGEDPLKTWQIPKTATGSQLIRELTAKAIRCRSFYEQNLKEHKALEAFLRGLVGPYRILMRTLIRWLGDDYPPPQEFLEVVAQLEERLRIDLEGFRQVQLLKGGSLKLFKQEVRALFERVLSEAEMLTGLAVELVERRAP